MSETTPITITVYPLLSSDGFHDIMPDDLFDVLKTMDADPNTHIDIKPIAPHMLRPVYTVFHITQVKFKNFVADEPLATATNIGTAYYTILNNYPSEKKFEFLSNLFGYDEQPTQTQLHRELTRCTQDIDDEQDDNTEPLIAERYAEAVTNKTYNNRIGKNTQEFLEQLKKSSQSDEMTYVWINNQPLDVANTDTLRKAAMSQFFAQSAADEYEWLEDDTDTDTDETDTTSQQDKRD